MTQERWEEICQKIRDNFEVVATYSEELNPGTADVIEFHGPLGTLRAKLNRQPKVLDKKTLYSHRAGGEVKVDYSYSDTEKVLYLTVEKWNEERQNWAPMDAGSFFL